MQLSELTEALNQYPDAGLAFVLPDGSAVAQHFHVTEVGRVRKDFIDCGGTVRQTDACVLQVWVADDVDHKLEAAGGRGGGMAKNPEQTAIDSSRTIRSGGSRTRPRAPGTAGLLRALRGFVVQPCLAPAWACLGAGDLERGRRTRCLSAVN